MRSMRRCARFPSIAAKTWQMLRFRDNLVEPRAEIDARLRTVPLVPNFAYKYPFVFCIKRYTESRVVSFHVVV